MIELKIEAIEELPKDTKKYGKEREHLNIFIRDISYHLEEYREEINYFIKTCEANLNNNKAAVSLSHHFHQLMDKLEYSHKQMKHNIELIYWFVKVLAE